MFGLRDLGTTGEFMRILEAMDAQAEYKYQLSRTPKALEEDSVEEMLAAIETPAEPRGYFGEPDFYRVRFLSVDGVQLRCPNDDRMFRSEYVTEGRGIWSSWAFEDRDKISELYQMLLDRENRMRPGSIKYSEDGNQITLEFGIRRPPKADEKLIALGFLVYQKDAEWGWYVMSPSLHSECVEPHFRGDTETHPVLWAQKRAELTMGAMLEALGGDCPGNDIARVYENLASVVCNPIAPELEAPVEYDLSPEQRRWLQKQQEWFTSSEKRFPSQAWCPELIYILLQYQDILMSAPGGKAHPVNEFAATLPQALENGLVIRRVCQLQQDLEEMYNLSALESLERALELIVDIYTQGQKPWWFEENICVLAGLEERTEEIDIDTLGLLAQESGFAFREALVPYLDFGRHLEMEGIGREEAVVFFAQATKAFGIGNPIRLRHILSHAQELVKELPPGERVEALKKFLTDDVMAQAPESPLLSKMQGNRAGIDFPGMLGLLDKEFIAQNKLDDDDTLRPKHLKLALGRLALPLEERNLRIPVKPRYLGAARKNPSHGLLLGDSSGQREIYALETTQGRPAEETDNLALVKARPLSSLQDFYERLRLECRNDEGIARNYFAFCAGHMPDPLHPPEGFLTFLKQFMDIRDPEWRWEGLEHPHDRVERSNKNAESRVNRMLFITSMLELWKRDILDWETVWGYFQWIVADIPESQKRELEAQTRKYNEPDRRRKRQRAHLSKKEIFPEPYRYYRGDMTDEERARLRKSHSRKLARLKKVMGVRECADDVFYRLEGERHIRVSVPKEGTRRWEKRKRNGTLPEKPNRMDLDRDDYISISRQRAKRALARVRQSAASEENNRKNHEWEEGERKFCHPSDCYPPEKDYYSHEGWSGFVNEVTRAEQEWERAVAMEMKFVRSIRLKALRETIGIEEPLEGEHVGYEDEHDAMHHHIRYCIENQLGEARTEQQNQRLGAAMACLSQMEFLSDLVQRGIIDGPQAAELWRDFLVLAIEEPAKAKELLYDKNFFPELSGVAPLLDTEGVITRLQGFSGVEFWEEIGRWVETTNLLSTFLRELEILEGKLLHSGRFHRSEIVFSTSPETIRGTWNKQIQELETLWGKDVEVLRMYLRPFEEVAEPIIKEWEEKVDQWKDYVSVRAEYDQAQENDGGARHTVVAGQNACSLMTPYLLLKRIAQPNEKEHLLPELAGGVLPARSKIKETSLTVTSAKFPRFEAVAKEIEARIKEERKKYFGLPPIGAKIHMLRKVSDETFYFLREALGLNSTAFRLLHAGAMLCLPAMPTSFELENLVRLLAIDGVVNEDEPELQLCMSGDFKDKEDIAILMSAMMLSTRKMFRFTEKSFMPRDNMHYHQTAAMMAARGAGRLNEQLPFARTSEARIDKLGCGDLEDIHRYHLLAGILEEGPMSDLAADFKRKYKAILERYGLLSVLDAPWVFGTEGQKSSSELAKPHFEQAVQPCMNAWFDNTEAYSEGEGLIYEVQELFDELDERIRNRSKQLLKQSQYEPQRRTLFNF